MHDKICAKMIETKFFLTIVIRVWLDLINLLSNSYSFLIIKCFQNY